VGAASLLDESAPAESSEQVRQRVLAARAVAGERWASLGLRLNAEIPGHVLRRRPYRLPASATAPLTRSLDNGSLSARGFDRVLRVAWSIVDMDGRASPSPEDV